MNFKQELEKVISDKVEKENKTQEIISNEILSALRGDFCSSSGEYYFKVTDKPRFNIIKDLEDSGFDVEVHEPEDRPGEMPTYRMTVKLSKNRTN